jgi:sodium transport system ATP-binding protein
MITVEQVSKRYGKVTALERASFTARDGEITALIGANGSGKTTLLRAIASLVEPDNGRVAVDGIDVALQKQKALARIGFMPDGGGLYPMLTAREHVEVFARLHGLSGRELRRSVDDAVAALGLTPIAKRRTRGFSAGERMRVALARTIVHRPKNLILDEPSRGLDLGGLRLLRTLLEDFREDGVCIVLSSHVLSDVEVLADSVVMLEAGALRATGTPKQLIAQAGATNLEDAYFTLLSKVHA